MWITNGMQASNDKTSQVGKTYLKPKHNPVNRQSPQRKQLNQINEVVWLFVVREHQLMILAFNSTKRCTLGLFANISRGNPVIMSSCHHFIIPSFHYVIMSSIHHFIISQFHHFISRTGPASWPTQVRGSPTRTSPWLWCLWMPRGSPSLPYQRWGCMWDSF